jgi:2-polyprenyl-3-methyl-5-hydroxy-6-metoxy-1,4-benzoquinol methylase
MIHPINRLDLYASPANHDLVNRSQGLTIRRILDVGAGTGSNLHALKQLHPQAHAAAITCSYLEAAQLEKLADQTIVADLNQLIDSSAWQTIGLGDDRFDLILLSHVLEHLQEPAQVLESISSLLSADGLLLIALPNICHWRTRLQIARGSFQYQESGVLDRSHLRFFTYWSARELVESCHSLTLIHQWPVGGAILGPLRAQLPQRSSQWLDRQASQRWPNLFGFETHLLARRR